MRVLSPLAWYIMSMRKIPYVGRSVDIDHRIIDDVNFVAVVLFGIASAANGATKVMIHAKI